MHTCWIRLVLFIILGLAVKEDAKFYLMDSGTDTSPCGRNVSATCRTFSWLLGVFYNESYTNSTETLTLNLMLGSSLLIEPYIQVRYISFHFVMKSINNFHWSVVWCVNCLNFKFMSSEFKKTSNWNLQSANETNEWYWSVLCRPTPLIRPTTHYVFTGCRPSSPKVV